MVRARPSLEDLPWAAAGYAIGRGLGYLTFHLPMRASLSRTGDGFVALAVTLIAYGVVEMLGGFGFLAVFVSALALRNASRDDDYHDRLHGFAEEAERLQIGRASCRERGCQDVEIPVVAVP